MLPRKLFQHPSSRFMKGISALGAMLWNSAEQAVLRYRYARRIVRAARIRALMRLALLGFALEKRFSPVVEHQEKRILLIVIGGLGDCLLFQPLFQRLKEHWGGARIDVLTGQCFEDMWERLDSVDDLIYLPFPNEGWGLRAYASLLRTIYRNRYDIVAEGISMVPRKGIYPILTSLIFDASRAPIRIGTDHTGRFIELRPKKLRLTSRERRSIEIARMPGSANGRKNPHLTHLVELLPVDQRPYHVSSRIFQPLGIPFDREKNPPILQPDPRKTRWAKTLLRSQWAPKSDVVIGVTLETTATIKSWPIENFLTVLEKGIGDNLKFVLLGLERTSPDSPFRHLPGKHLLNLTGHTSLAELIAVIHECDLFLSCDVGPSHIAQACRVPSIVLFGPSNEMEFGPIDHEMHTLMLPPEDFPCRPCVLGPCVRPKTCMHTISPAAVYEEVAKKARGLRDSIS